MGINSVHFSGYVGQDPEIKYLESGKVIGNFTIAVTNFSKGEKVTMWLSCKAFDRLAEFIGEHIKKGTHLTAQGKLTEDKWEDSNGQQRSKFYVVVNDLAVDKHKEVGKYNEAI